MIILDQRTLRFLDDLPKNATGLEIASTLRKTLTVPQALAATEQYSLRRKAISQRGDSRLQLLTRKGLEQSTHPLIAAWRARHLNRNPIQGAFWDATCGLGSDSLALMDEGIRVIASDRDPIAAACAEHNLRVSTNVRSPSVVLVCDATESAVDAAGILIDPDRRVDGRRSLDPTAWSPPLEKCLALLATREVGCLKLPPSLDPDEDLLGGGTLCWVSLDRELKEVCFFTGLAATPGSSRRVVALSRDGSEESLEGEPMTLAAFAPEDVGSISWLANPDPALLRSGLLEREGDRHGLRPLAPQLAWMGSAEEPQSPFFKCRRVLGSAPADPRRVRRMLTEFDVGPIEVWKRGHPDRAEILGRRFRGKGSKRGILAIGRLEKGHHAWLLDPASGSGL